MRRSRQPRRAYRTPNPIGAGTILALIAGTALLGVGAYYAFKPSTAAAAPPALPPPAAATPQTALVAALNNGTATAATLQAAGGVGALTPAQVGQLTAAAKNLYTALSSAVLAPGVTPTPATPSPTGDN